MTWVDIKEWLETHEHISPTWDCVEVNEDSFYAEDEMENTFISIFTRSNDELVVYVGCLRPKISVGGETGYQVTHSDDIIYFLEDNLEDMYNELMRKVM
jgi:hypothetical protein